MYFSHDTGFPLSPTPTGVPADWYLLFYWPIFRNQPVQDWATARGDEETYSNETQAHSRGSSSSLSGMGSSLTSPLMTGFPKSAQWESRVQCSHFMCILITRLLPWPESSPMYVVG